MANVYFLPGLYGSNTYDKIEAARGGRGIKPELTYSSTATYTTNFNNLTSTMGSQSTSTIIIGESTGAFYAVRLAYNYNCRCFLINPVTDPATEMSQFISGSLLQSYINAFDPRAAKMVGKIALMTSFADNIIDPDKAETYFANYLAYYVLSSALHVIEQPEANLVGSVVNTWEDGGTPVPLYINHRKINTMPSSGLLYFLGYQKGNTKATAGVGNNTSGTQAHAQTVAIGMAGSFRLPVRQGDVVSQVIYATESDWKFKVMGLYPAP